MCENKIFNFKQNFSFYSIKFYYKKKIFTFACKSRNNSLPEISHFTNSPIKYNFSFYLNLLFHKIHYEI